MDGWSLIKNRQLSHQLEIDVQHEEERCCTTGLLVPPPRDDCLGDLQVKPVAEGGPGGAVPPPQQEIKFGAPPN